MRLEEEKSEKELAIPTNRDLRHIAQMNTDKKKEKELTTKARRTRREEGYGKIFSHPDKSGPTADYTDCTDKKKHRARKA